MSNWRKGGTRVEQLKNPVSTNFHKLISDSLQDSLCLRSTCKISRDEEEEEEEEAEERGCSSKPITDHPHWLAKH